MIFRRIAPGTPGGLWTVPVDGTHEATAIPGTENRGANGRVSPDGRWLAYQASVPGNVSRSEVFVQPVPPTGQVWQISRNQGGWPLWRSDGKELFYVALDLALDALSATVTGVPVSPNASSPFGAPTPLFTHAVLNDAGSLPAYRYAVSRDGQRFLIKVPEKEEATMPITVLLNWPAVLHP